MTPDPLGWGIDDYAAAYASGTSVREVVDAVLELLDPAPSGVLIGAPLGASARAEAARLDGLDVDASSLLPLFGVRHGSFGG